MSPRDSIASLTSPTRNIRFGEFVGLIAAIMSLNALSIDTMLPALAKIAESFGLTAGNQRQWVVGAYLLGFGTAQIVFGSVSDRFGRRPVLLACLGLYFTFSLFAALAPTFSLLIASRALQGAAAAGLRVVAVAVVRDRYQGRQMAKVMSLTFVIFLIVPIVAPSIGQLLLRALSWHFIFVGFAAAGAIILVWSALRLPETMRAEFAESNLSDAWNAWRSVATNRASIGYTLGTTFILGGLIAFISSVQQIYADAFQLPRQLPAVFIAVGTTMAAASLLNARIVERVGMRRVSHTALLAFALIAVVHATIALMHRETPLSFLVCQALMMGSFALTAPNFGALAMEPFRAAAGTASSLQGFVQTVGGTALGATLGQFYNGSTVPLTIGYVAFAALAILTILITERGRLFHGTPAADFPSKSTAA